MSIRRRTLAGLPAAVAAGVLALACGGGPPGGAGEGAAGEVWWPRFPFALDTHVERDVAVLYSTDGLGPNTTLADLGYPGRRIFRLHQDHPQLKVVLTSCPANRYSGGRPVDGSTEAGASWRSLALDPRFDWIELANQGYTHAPEEDANLSHHEFSVRQKGCNIDHALLGALDYCRARFRLVREAYRSLGIPDARVTLVRFPGSEDSPAALQAAREAGFLAVMGSRHLNQTDRDWWTPTADGQEILEIQNTKLLPLFARSEALEAALTQGRIDPARVAESPGFQEAVRRGEAYVEKVAAGGGILNLADQWRETFTVIGGAAPRYLVLGAVLDFIERRHGPRAWYPSGRELALWLQARHQVAVSSRTEGGALLVRAEAPPWWRDVAPDGFAEVSFVVRLPDGWSEAGRVSLRQGPGDSAWRELGADQRWPHPRGLAVIFPLSGTATLRIERGA